MNCRAEKIFMKEEKSEKFLESIKEDGKARIIKLAEHG